MSMQRMAFASVCAALVLWAGAVVSAQTRSARIMSERERKAMIEELESILEYKDAELEQLIPYIINPFFFEQPLLLKLRAPGGISDQDILTAFSSVLLDEVSGAFVRGDRRSLLMKSGELLREGEKITRSLPALGGVQASVEIGLIERESFLLKLNSSELAVVLTER
jgi:hypothetical protein